MASAASWTPEEQLTYVESLGVCKLPGEDRIKAYHTPRTCLTVPIFEGKHLIIYSKCT